MSFNVYIAKTWKQYGVGAEIYLNLNLSPQYMYKYLPYFV